MTAPDRPPAVVIVIVSYNTRDVLHRCLDSIHGAPPAVSHRLVVVDNASTDGTVARLREAWPDVQLLALPRNVGFAAATNAGIAASDSELVLLLNSDTIVPPGHLDRLVAALEAEAPGRATGAIGPRLVDAHGRPELSFGAMLSPWNEARQKLIGLGIAAGLPPCRWWLRRRTTTAHDADWVSGACLLVRRSCGDAVGWLDERFFLYGEDVDFCAALRAAGYRVRFTPAAEIVHLRGESGAADPAATRAYYRRSQVAFYRKHHPRWAGLLRWWLRMRREWPDEPSRPR